MKQLSERAAAHEEFSLFFVEGALCTFKGEIQRISSVESLFKGTVLDFRLLDSRPGGGSFAGKVVEFINHLDMYFADNLQVPMILEVSPNGQKTH